MLMFQISQIKFPSQFLLQVLEIRLLFCRITI
jgi:hypothetical protein